MNREEAARVLSSMRDTLKKVYLVAIDEERISALESAVGYLLAEDNNVPIKQPDPITGLVPCGCGGELVLHNCSDREFTTTFYVQCGNEVCRMSVGRHYDPINHCRRGEFTDAKSAVKAANRAMGYKGGAE